jgi:hypothetical protein
MTDEEIVAALRRRAEEKSSPLVVRNLHTEAASRLEDYRRDLLTAAEKARRIYSGLVGRLPMEETDADKSARVAADDELAGIFQLTIR